MATSCTNVLVVSDSSRRMRALDAALTVYGVGVMQCHDWACYQESLSESPAPCAVVLDFASGDGPVMEALRGTLSSSQPRPVSVAILPRDLLPELPEAVAIGADLPITAELDCRAIARAAVELIERRRGPRRVEWLLDTVRWLLLPPEGDSPARLNYKERDFLAILAQQPGQPVQRESFASLFGTTPELLDPRRVEIMVRRLRNKVIKDTGSELPLHTAHGVGYALASPILIVDLPALAGE